MHKIARKTLTASAVAATAIALTAMPASAAPITTVTIQNGGDIEGTNVGSIIGFGNLNGSTLECTSSTGMGSTPVVSGTVSADNAAQLDNVTFSSPGEVNDWCVANGSIPTEVTALGLPWIFDANDDGNDSGPGGTTLGRLEGVQVKLHGPSVPCDAVVGGPNGTDGYIEGVYTNPSSLTGNDGTLSLAFGANNNLEVLSTVGQCEGLISVGETVAIAGTYNVQRTGPVPPPAGISPTID